MLRSAKPTRPKRKLDLKCEYHLYALWTLRLSSMNNYNLTCKQLNKAIRIRSTSNIIKGVFDKMKAQVYEIKEFDNERKKL